jgi:Na+/proline symporter
MSTTLILAIIIGYFFLLLLIAQWTGRNATSDSFFTGNRNSPWYVVAFGMIGASLSGVTFISVPGEVGNTAWGYFQMVLGYQVGYWVIAMVLLPLYYRLGLVSIYSYLKDRFGVASYKTGSAFFLLSQLIGASFRLFLVAGVLQLAVFNTLGVPFWVSVLITIALIWMYTFKAGIKTVVWTDTLQTFFMLAAVVFTLFIVAGKLDLGFFGVIETVAAHPFSKIIETDWRSGQFFAKQFVSGAFIAIVMTGLDQNMMQKNLTCRNLKDAQKNIAWFSPSLIPVNLLFLALGVLLYIYAEQFGVTLPSRTDELFPFLALNHFGTITAIFFLLGITAAAYSSADSSLTSLTTAFCIDFLAVDIANQENTKRTKLFVHIGFSFAMFAVIMLFYALNDSSVISAIFRAAGYTYGPLLGLFAFGLFTKYKINDRWAPIICVASPILCYIISSNSAAWFNGYQFGYELLLLNGAFTALGLYFIRLGEK